MDQIDGVGRGPTVRSKNNIENWWGSMWASTSHRRYTRMAHFALLLFAMMPRHRSVGKALAEARPSRKESCNKMEVKCRCHIVYYLQYNQTISINVYSQGDCCNPSGFLTSRPNLFVKLFVGMFSGSRCPIVIVKMFYLCRVTLKLKVICVHSEVDNVHDLHIQGHGVTPQHSVTDIRTLCLKHRYRHQDYLPSIVLAINAKNNRKFSFTRTLSCLCHQRAGYMRNHKNIMCQNV